MKLIIEGTKEEIVSILAGINSNHWSYPFSITMCDSETAISSTSYEVNGYDIGKTGEKFAPYFGKSYENVVS